MLIKKAESSGIGNESLEPVVKLREVKPQNFKTMQKILVVDDDEDIRAIAQIALEDFGGFTVELCSTGDEAIAKAEAFEPDLFLLDAIMPDMDGLTTLYKLRQLPTMITIPVVFLTAVDQQSWDSMFKQLGVIGVISKPFDPLTLADTIHKFWLNYHERNDKK